MHAHARQRQDVYQRVTEQIIAALAAGAGTNPVLVEAFHALGAEPVPMPMAKPVVDAVARGALDGLETDINSVLNWEFFRWAKYLSLTGHVYSPGTIVMSKAAYDRLSDADRQAFVETARLAAHNSRKRDDDTEAAGLAQLLGVGMKINTDVDKAAFRAALAPAYAKWREQFGNVIERIKAHP